MKELPKADEVLNEIFPTAATITLLSGENGHKYITQSMIEYTKRVLDYVAENATTIETDHMTGKLYPDGAPSGYDTYDTVDKESILKIKSELK